MANTSSAKKAIRAQAKKTVKNLHHKRDFRDARKEVKTALTKKSKKNLETSISNFHKAIDKAAKTHSLHKNTASRYKSRLAKLVNSTKLEK